MDYIAKKEKRSMRDSGPTLHGISVHSRVTEAQQYEEDTSREVMESQIFEDT